MLWQIFEISVNFFETFIILESLSHILGFKNEGLKRYLGFSLAYIISLSIETVINHFTIFEGISIFILVLLNFIYCFVCLKGTLFKKFFYSVLIVIVIVLINSLTAFSVNLATGVSVENLMAVDGVYRFTFVVITKLTFFYVTRLLIKYNEKETQLKWIDWLVIISIFILSVLSIVAIMNITLYDNKKSFYSLITVISVIITNILTLYLFFKISADSKLRTEYSLIKQQREMALNHVNEVCNLYEQISIMRHDIKNHLFLALNLLNHGSVDSAKEYLSKLTEQISNTYNLVQSHDDILDCILNSKFSKAKNAGLNVRSLITVKRGIISDIDMSIILNNLLDNAIEASEKSSKKILDFSIKQQGAYLVICVKNSINNSILVNNPNLNTTKNNKEFHGLGLKSIKSVAEKYNGWLNIYEDNGYFCIEAWLQNQEEYAECT